MTRHVGWIVGGGLMLASSAALAQGKQRACDLLKAEEVTSAVGAPSSPPLEHDETIADGPWKGETQRRCNWPLGENGGKGNVYLMVTALRTDAQRKASTEVLDKVKGQFESQGWQAEKKSVGDAACVVGTPPPSQKKVSGAVTCLARVRHSAVSIGAVSMGAKLTPEQVKALLEKAAGRLEAL